LVKSIGENDVSVPIGKAIANSVHYVLDMEQNPVPIGVPGELYLGGDGLSLGYYGKPELTEELFIKNPFDPENKIYKTGDLVRYGKDGNIEFIGRIDNQVKIRGFRIELGEIENALRDLDGIKDSVVNIEGESSLNKKIVAYVLLQDGDNSIIGELSRLLSKKLPNYMIPNQFLSIEYIPLTPNGKIDKNALANLNVDNFSSEKLFVEPRTNFQKYLSMLWTEILSIEKISIHDNFFAMGGNSLQAAICINRLQKKINKDIQVQSIFLAPTIAEFSHFAQEYYSNILSEIFNEDGNVIKSDFQLIKNEKLTEEKITEFINIVTNKNLSDKEFLEKNPQAVFILSPPRSGSTLLRVMLEGHDKLFSPPELDLLTFENLKERKEKLSGNHKLWLEASIRAIMELKNCKIAEAEKIMEAFENQNMSVKDFYRQLQIWSGEKILVDKTPTYGMDINVLKKAEQYFNNPLYIHLTRHPYASIYSFIEAKLDNNFFRYEHSFNRSELAELIWLTSHKNILNFLEEIPETRKIKISFEDLLLDSVKEMKKISNFLGIEYSEKLINPYDGKRMTDPAKENSQMVGDFKFYLRNKIDTNAINRWKNYHRENFLSDNSMLIADKLGYSLSTEFNSESKDNSLEILNIPSNQESPLSYAQQRIWFLDQLDPGKSTYNIPAVVELKGDLNINFLEKSIVKIIERQESLRSYFDTIDGKP
ncbi:MAG: sulfotransferase, partial [Ignavibacteriae bacterium]|nr:sulfotransferase [Ignavibacteriota bacterium]